MQQYPRIFLITTQVLGITVLWISQGILHRQQRSLRCSAYAPDGLSGNNDAANWRLRPAAQGFRLQVSGRL